MTRMIEHRPAGADGFDLFWGRWRIANERLTERLVGSSEWERFEAECDCRPVLGGIGNVDSFETNHWQGGFRGGTIRIFDPTGDCWRLHWMDTIRCQVFPPVVGSFAEGVGTFFGEDREGDVPVGVRFIWSGITPTGATWEQAFSTDDGATWETNWIMRHTRIAGGWID